MSAVTPESGFAAPDAPSPFVATTAVLVWRLLAWLVIAMMLVFLLNNYLTHWRGWPGLVFRGENTVLVAIQWLTCAAGVTAAIVYCWRWRERSLRHDARIIYAASAYFIRACYWVVIFVGLVDMAISFARVEGVLPLWVGSDLASDLGRPHFRGNYVHVPLIALAFVVAAFTRTLGFTWLALLVVVAELQIVIGRFIFSYEQAFMGDLVRFWYAALFLFASAYTLIEEGHVRVDVVYAGLGQRAKGLVNVIGSILLGMSLCVVILAVGMGSKNSIINSALVNFEVSQAGFGMYIKYLMAGFLGVFAISMLLQFVGYMLEGVADWRNDPDRREIAATSAH